MKCPSMGAYTCNPREAKIRGLLSSRLHGVQGYTTLCCVARSYPQNKTTKLQKESQKKI